MTSSIVLCSGGWESTAVAVMKRWPLLFVDYGQSYAAQERAAVTRLASVLGLPLHMTHARVNRACRNFDLLRLAKAEGATEVGLGCRAISKFFDCYGDCHPAALKREADLMQIRVCLPLVGVPDFMVRRIVQRGLSQQVVYSSKGLAM